MPLFVLFFTNGSLFANELSLKDAVAYAMAHNANLQVAGSRVYQAQAEVDVATGKMLPHVDVATGFTRTNSSLGFFGAKLQQQQITAADFTPASLNQPGYINNYQSRLALNMPLFAGGALLAGRKQADALAQSVNMRLHSQRQQVIYQTIVAYMQASQAAAEIKSSEKAVQAADQRWLDAKALYVRGMVLESDVMDAHVYVLRSQVARSEADDVYTNSLEFLRLVMGMDMAQPILKLQEPTLAGVDDSIESLQEKSLSQRSDLIAMQHELEAATSARKVAYASDLPRVDLVAGQEWNSETIGLKNRNSMIGLTMTMNIFNGGSDQARLRSVESQYASLSFQLHDKKQQIKHEIAQAWRHLNIAGLRFKSEQEALQQTQESLRIKLLRYKQGLEKTADVLSAQVKMDTSSVTYIQAKYDVMVARAALMLAAGILDEGVIQ